MTPNDIGEDNLNAFNVNTALSFFDDTNINTSTFQTIQSYEAELEDLSLNFNLLINQIKVKAKKEVQPYGQNNFSQILANSGYNNLELVISKYLELKSNLESISEKINVEIDAINLMIESEDNLKLLAELKLQRLLNSNNAAIGLLKDTNYLSNVIISENILLIIITIVFIIFQFKFEKK